MPRFKTGNQLFSKGFDMASWDEFWGGLKDKMNDGLEQAQAVGIPMIKASAEQWAIDTLTAQKQATQSELDAAVKTLSNNPSSPIGQAASSVIRDSVFANYGGWIIGGVLIVGIAGAMIMRK